MKLIQSVIVDFYEVPATFGMGLAGGLLLGVAGCLVCSTMLEEKEEYRKSDREFKKHRKPTPVKAMRRFR